MEELKLLVSKAQAGDQKAFSMLVYRVKDLAYGDAYALLGDFHLAQDAAQNSLVEMYRQLPTLKIPEAFISWFKRIVFKQTHRLLRARKISPSSLDENAVSLELQSVMFHEDNESELAEKVLAEVRKLPEPQRLAMTLFYIGNYSEREVAAFLELPLTTLKKRLADARKKLRTRLKDDTIMSKIPEVMQKHVLPPDFAPRLLRFPFPVTAPQVKIEDFNGALPAIYCIDAHQFFLPLNREAQCDWAFYDYPGARLSGVNECRIIAEFPWGNGRLLREWTRYTAFNTDNSEWKESNWREEHLQVDQNSWQFVNLNRNDQGQLHVSNFIFPDRTFCDAFPMTLSIGMKWGNMTNFTEVTGTSKITIGKKGWKCLKLITRTFREPDKKKYPALLEYYISEAGRTIFARRYNSLGWRLPDQNGSFESLSGNLEIKYDGVSYRHWYDCVPDIAFDGKLL